MIDKLLHNKAFMAALCAIGVIVTQVMNVVQVGEIGHTLFGTVSHGIWVSTIELQLMVLLQVLLGPLAALGVIFTSFAFSLSVNSPSFLMPTILSKVIALGVTTLVFYVFKDLKFIHRLNLAFLNALIIDVFAFALLANLPGIVVTSVIIRLVLHTTTMVIIYGVLYYRDGKELA